MTELFLSLFSPPQKKKKKLDQKSLLGLLKETKITPCISLYVNRQEPEQTGAVEKSDPRKDTAKTSQLYPEEALLSLPEEWDFTMARKPAADDRPKLQRYHFLTEREAR